MQRRRRNLRDQEKKREGNREGIRPGKEKRRSKIAFRRCVQAHSKNMLQYNAASTFATAYRPRVLHYPCISLMHLS